jgi:pyrimidine operon attenuation protein / uracil phosphoribosyltransferase
MKTIITSRQMGLTIRRMAHQIVEENPAADKLHVIGIQPRGIWLSNRLVGELNLLYGHPVAYGQIDITFYRDDIRRELMIPNETHIPFNIDGQRVLLVDDVLYTGRTIRSALDALIDFGRPAKVELCVLIDRQFNREIPIQPDFTGLAIDTIFSQDVKVFWQDRDGKDEVVLLDEKGR